MDGPTIFSPNTWGFLLFSRSRSTLLASRRIGWRRLTEDQGWGRCKRRISFSSGIIPYKYLIRGNLYLHIYIYIYHIHIHIYIYNSYFLIWESWYFAHLSLLKCGREIGNPNFAQWEIHPTWAKKMMTSLHWWTSLVNWWLGLGESSRYDLTLW